MKYLWLGIAVLSAFGWSVGAQDVRNNTVAGRIIHGADRTPAAGVRVVIAEWPAADAGHFTVTRPEWVAWKEAETDRDGRYRFEDVTPGRYLIAAGAADSPTYFPGSRTTAGARVIDVSFSAKTPDLDFALGGSRIAGRIEGIPENVPTRFFRIELASNDEPHRPPLETPVQPDGAFELLNVPTGKWTLSMVPWGRFPALKAIETDSADIDGVEVTFDPNWLFGKIVIEDGSKLPPNPNPRETFLHFNVRGPEGLDLVQFVHSDGFFGLGGAQYPPMPLPAGNYRLSLAGLPGPARSMFWCRKTTMRCCGKLSKTNAVRKPSTP